MNKHGFRFCALAVIVFTLLFLGGLLIPSYARSAPNIVDDIIIMPRNYIFTWGSSGASIVPQNTVYCSSNPDFTRVLYWRTSDSNSNAGINDWNPTILVAGQYDIYAFMPLYTHSASITTQAKYYFNGTLLAQIDQNQGLCDPNIIGSGWVLLGRRWFNTGTGDTISMPAQTPDNPWRLISADGLKLVFVNTPPNTPNLIAPPNGSQTASGNITLQIQDTGDPDNYPRNYRDYSYRIEKSDNSWSQDSGWITNTSWNLTLPSPGIYQWRVQSGDGELPSAWSGWWTIYYNVVPTYGFISGRVTNASNGSGISGAQVSVGSRSTQTDGSGNYGIVGIPVGSYTFTVTKDGYISHQSNVTIVTGGNTKNVALTPRLTGMTRPVSPYTQVNAFRDQHSSNSLVYDYFHPVGSSVNIGGRWYTAPWPAGKWRLGIAYNGHSGTDFNGVLNATNVIAPSDGYVVAYRDQDPNYNRDLPGNYVMMKHTVNGRTFYAIYLHLNKGSIPQQIKQASGRNILIPRGTLLGKIGMSGNTTGPHLHFGVSNCKPFCGTFDPYEAGLWASGNTPLFATITNDWLGAIPISDTNLLPTAAFTISVTAAQISTTISLDASASQDPDGTLVQYLWDFGDGSQAQGITATHIYTSTGAFDIFLTVVDDLGGADLSEAQSVVITSDPPVGDITLPQFDLGFDGSGVTSALTVTLQLTLTMPENPAQIQMRFGLNDQPYGAWEPFSEHKSLLLEASEEMQYIHAQLKDAAGNPSSPVTLVAIYDTTAPVVTLGDPITDDTQPGAITFVWEIEDDGDTNPETLVSEFLLAGVDLTWQTIANDNPTITYQGLASGVYTFFVRVTDWAGNQSTDTVTVYISVPKAYIYLPAIVK